VTLSLLSQLARARAAQADPAWQADYTATRRKVERKIGHLMRRRHGGRRVCVRGTAYRPRLGRRCHMTNETRF
jgi:hypothetical protein